MNERSLSAQSLSHRVLLAAISGAITSELGYAWNAVLPSLTATWQLTVPMIAAAGGVALLGERITLRFLIAAVMILGGVPLTLLRRSPAR